MNEFKDEFFKQIESTLSGMRDWEHPSWSAGYEECAKDLYPILNDMREALLKVQRQIDQDSGNYHSDFDSVNTVLSKLESFLKIK